MQGSWEGFGTSGEALIMAAATLVPIVLQRDFNILSILPNLIKEGSMTTLIETSPMMELRPHDIDNLIDELRAYHALYSPPCSNVANSGSGRPTISMACCWTSRANRSSPWCWPCEVTMPTPYAACNSLSVPGRGDDQPILERHWCAVDQTLGDEDGVLTLDGSDFLKQVASRSTGVSVNTVGKSANAPTVRQASFWAMPATQATPCWIAACICLRNGLKTIATQTADAHVVFPTILPSRPSPNWAGT